MNKYKEAYDYFFEKHNDSFLDRHYLDVMYELVEKATPKKVIANGIRDGRTINTVSYTCPVCNNHIGRNYFCKHCGQALDWSK